MWRDGPSAPLEHKKNSVLLCVLPDRTVGWDSSRTQKSLWKFIISNHSDTVLSDVCFYSSLGTWKTSIKASDSCGGSRAHTC